MMQSHNPATVTAQQKATWDNHTPIYAQFLIRTNEHDCTGQQVISAVNQHKQLTAGAQILDTASSAGKPAVAIAKALPHVHVVSTDLAPSSASLALGYAGSQGAANVSAQTADAQDLKAFADGTFAAVTCTYGLLFMPEFEKALKEAHRVLQAGGLYVATLWADPEQVQMTQLIIGLATKLVGEQMASRMFPPGIRVPTDLPQYLQQAGFTHVTSKTYSHPLQFSMEDLTVFLVGPQSQLAGMLNKLQAAGRTNVHEEAKQMLREVCEERGVLKDGIVSTNNTAILFTAVKP